MYLYVGEAALLTLDNRNCFFTTHLDKLALGIWTQYERQA